MKTKDLIGNTYGSLLVISKHKAGTGKESLWTAVCKCGNKVHNIRTSKLKDGKRKTCGKCKLVDRKEGEFSEQHKRLATENSGRSRFSQLTLEKQLLCINRFAMGETITKIADDLSLVRDGLRDGIKLFRMRLNEIYELHYMAEAEKTVLPQETIDKALMTRFVESKLIDKLSPADSDELTPAELLYCYLFVNTGSNDTALRESELDSCLSDKKPIKKQLLGMYLRNKPNLKEYISILKEARIEETKSSKKHIQSELINQVEQLRETVSTGGRPADRSHLLKAIELLGKTVGAFEERVRVTEVSAADALDELLELAKSDTSIKELPAGTSADEVWE